jgi:hypothetical protein
MSVFEIIRLYKRNALHEARVEAAATGARGGRGLGVVAAATLHRRRGRGLGGVVRIHRLGRHVGHRVEAAGADEAIQLATGRHRRQRGGDDVLLGQDALYDTRALLIPLLSEYFNTRSGVGIDYTFLLSFTIASRIKQTTGSR